MYGLSHISVEQISSGGTVTYLHHDQAGSTRLLTGSTGTVTGKCTYSAYGPLPAKAPLQRRSGLTANTPARTQG
jgi:hypothetical protein